MKTGLFAVDIVNKQPVHRLIRISILRKQIQHAVVTINLNHVPLPEN